MSEIGLRNHVNPSVQRCRSKLKREVRRTKWEPEIALAEMAKKIYK